jgi:hypothetical protein
MLKVIEMFAEDLSKDTASTPKVLATSALSAFMLQRPQGPPVD